MLCWLLGNLGAGGGLDSRPVEELLAFIEGDGEGGEGGRGGGGGGGGGKQPAKKQRKKTKKVSGVLVQSKLPLSASRFPMATLWTTPLPAMVTLLTTPATSQLEVRLPLLIWTYTHALRFL